MVNCCPRPLGRWAAGPPARAAAAAAQAATPVRLGCLFELLLIRLIFKIDGDHEHGDKLRVFFEQPIITDRVFNICVALFAACLTFMFHKPPLG